MAQGDQGGDGRMTKERRIVFAVSEQGQGDGVPIVVMGIPAGAWDHMRDGATHTFDLTGAGVSAKLILFGADDHASVMATMARAANESKSIVLDEHTDFSIEPKPPEGG